MDTRTYSKSSSEYRLQARQQLTGNWGKFALLYLIVGVATWCVGLIPIFGSIIDIVVSGPIALGIAICMVHLMQSEPVALEDVLEGFKNFMPAFVVYLLVMIFTVLWTLLFIIPGIVAGYSYSMCFYILRENPTMPAREVIRSSKALMKGHRMDLFLLHLSFIGWALLAILTVGIGTLWLTPYVTASTTAFYLDLKAGQQPNASDSFFHESTSEPTESSPIEF